MRLSILIFLIITFLFFPFCQLQEVYAQHGNQGMTFDISIDNHDIEINQIKTNEIQISEKIMYNNTNNESYSGNINVFIQQNATIKTFGTVINDSFKAGTYSELSPVIIQYNLSENGIEIPANSSLRIDIDYNIEYSADNFIFEKVFYYSNYFLVVSVYPLNNTEIESSKIILDYNEEDNYYFAHDYSIKILGDNFIIYFIPKEESTNDSSFVSYLVIVIIVVVFIVFQINRKISEKKRAIKENVRKSKAKGKEEIRVGNSGIKEKSKKETHKRKKGIENMESLKEKKKNLLLAIKRLDEDNDAGLLSDDLYEDLKEDYKKRAVEVLKKIDEIE